MHQKKPIVSRDGSYQKIADPVFTPDEWESLQTVLDDRKTTKKRFYGGSPLGGVVVCGQCRSSCGHDIFESKIEGDPVYRYYRCNGYNYKKRCTGVSRRADEVEKLVEERFLDAVGHRYVKKFTFVPGEDNAKELKETKRRIERLRQDRELGAYDDDPEYYASKMKEYTSRIREMEQNPPKEAHWEAQELDVTYSQMWASSNQEDRRKLLRDSGIKFYIHGKINADIYIPEEIYENLSPTVA